MSSNIAAVILAAGRGTRMGSAKPKVLHEIGGVTMLERITGACGAAGAGRVIVVVGNNEDQIRRVTGDRVEYARQEQPLGSGDALKSALPQLAGFRGDLLVLIGDAPLITPQILSALIDKRRREKLGCVILTAVFDPIPPYGRVIRDDRGRVTEIIEEIDCTETQRLISEVHTSQYCLDAERVLPLVAEIPQNEKKGEYFLPHIVGLCHRRGFGAGTLSAPDPDITMGVNTPEELEKVRAWLAAQDR
ncbi:MAG: NTP transferase domain-containing protein [Acidobacteriota bacterium]|nr:NTP transferase domain-containing protein [Acidobacteriota bacterium]